MSSAASKTQRYSSYEPYSMSLPTSFATTHTPLLSTSSLVRDADGNFHDGRFLNSIQALQTQLASTRSPFASTFSSHTSPRRSGNGSDSSSDSDGRRRKYRARWAQTRQKAATLRAGPNSASAFDSSDDDGGGEEIGTATSSSRRLGKAPTRGAFGADLTDESVEELRWSQIQPAPPRSAPLVRVNGASTKPPYRPFRTQSLSASGYSQSSSDFRQQSRPGQNPSGPSSFSCGIALAPQSDATNQTLESAMIDEPQQVNAVIDDDDDIGFSHATTAARPLTQGDESARPKRRRRQHARTGSPSSSSTSHSPFVRPQEMGSRRLSVSSSSPSVSPGFQLLSLPPAVGALSLIPPPATGASDAGLPGPSLLLSTPPLAPMSPDEPDSSHLLDITPRAPQEGKFPERPSQHQSSSGSPSLLAHHWPTSFLRRNTSSNSRGGGGNGSATSGSVRNSPQLEPSLRKDEWISSFTSFVDLQEAARARRMRESRLSRSQSRSGHGTATGSESGSVGPHSMSGVNAVDPGSPEAVVNAPGQSRMSNPFVGPMLPTTEGSPASVSLSLASMGPNAPLPGFGGRWYDDEARRLELVRPTSRPGSSAASYSVSASSSPQLGPVTHVTDLRPRDELGDGVMRESSLFTSRTFGSVRSATSSVSASATRSSPLGLTLMRALSPAPPSGPVFPGPPATNSPRRASKLLSNLGLGRSGSVRSEKGSGGMNATSADGMDALGAENDAGADKPALGLVGAAEDIQHTSIQAPTPSSLEATSAIVPDTFVSSPTSSARQLRARPMMQLSLPSHVRSKHDGSIAPEDDISLTVEGSARHVQVPGAMVGGGLGLGLRVHQLSLLPPIPPTPAAFVPDEAEVDEQSTTAHHQSEADTDQAVTARPIAQLGYPFELYKRSSPAGDGSSQGPTPTSVANTTVSSIVAAESYFPLWTREPDERQLESRSSPPTSPSVPAHTTPSPVSSRFSRMRFQSTRGDLSGSPIAETPTADPALRTSGNTKFSRIADGNSLYAGQYLSPASGASSSPSRMPRKTRSASTSIVSMSSPYSSAAQTNTSTPLTSFTSLLSTPSPVVCVSPPVGTAVTSSPAEGRQRSWRNSRLSDQPGSIDAPRQGPPSSYVTRQGKRYSEALQPAVVPSATASPRGEGLLQFPIGSGWTLDRSATPSPNLPPPPPPPAPTVSVEPSSSPPVNVDNVIKKRIWPRLGLSRQRATSCSVPTTTYLGPGTARDEADEVEEPEVAMKKAASTSFSAGASLLGRVGRRRDSTRSTGASPSRAEKDRAGSTTGPPSSTNLAPRRRVVSDAMYKSEQAPPQPPIQLLVEEDRAGGDVDKMGANSSGSSSPATATAIASGSNPHTLDLLAASRRQMQNVGLRIRFGVLRARRRWEES
ncbi:hypothetical protein V8E36_000675 [Tilletia maclaganii]